jgi:K+-sensing histidine kinase KdpD
LSDQLSKNPDGNLTGRQTEYAQTIHSSGNDLLTLINDILDLSKIESGTVAVDFGELRLEELKRYVERTFRHVAESKDVDFAIELDTRVPAAIFTDAKRVQQVAQEPVVERVQVYASRRCRSVCELPAPVNSDNDALNGSDAVWFSVTDTGQWHSAG